MNIRKIASIFTAAVVAASTSLFTFSGTVNKANTASAVSTDELVNEFMSLVNEARATLGAEPLTVDPYISQIAQIRAEEQIERVGHTRPDDTLWITVIDQNKLLYKNAAENVLGGAGTAKSAFELWKNSEGHWKNITNSVYKYTGVGIAYDPDSKYGWYWVQIFSDAPSEDYTSKVTTGDLNSDDIIDANDASLILNEYATVSTNGTKTFTEAMTKAADVNGDGLTDAVDASLILGYYSYTSTGGTATIEDYLK